MCCRGPIPIDRSRRPPQARHTPRAPNPHNLLLRERVAISLPSLALPRSVQTEADSPAWPMHAAQQEQARLECGHERDGGSSLWPVDQGYGGGRNGRLADFALSAAAALDDPAEAAHHAD